MGTFNGDLTVYDAQSGERVRSLRSEEAERLTKLVAAVGVERAHRGGTCALAHLGGGRLVSIASESGTRGLDHRHPVFRVWAADGREQFGHIISGRPREVAAGPGWFALRHLEPDHGWVEVWPLPPPE